MEMKERIAEGAGYCVLSVLPDTERWILMALGLEDKIEDFERIKDVRRGSLYLGSHTSDTSWLK